jgi:1,4-dihydroxy-2-naphthoate octaprenyltransferase
MGTHYALSGTVYALPFLVSLPLACLAAAILHASHLRRFSADVNAKTRTLAVVLGWERARLLFYALAALPYVLVALLTLTGALPGWALLTFLSLPLVARCIVSVWHASAAPTQDLSGLDRQMARVHLGFGILLVFGLILG